MVLANRICSQVSQIRVCRRKGISRTRQIQVFLGVLGSVSSPQDTLPGLDWREPAEGLQCGELFLGAIASTYFARGLFSGYGFVFTDRRIIGLKMRRTGLVVKTPFTAVISILYLVALLETLSGGTPLLFLLPVLIHMASWPAGVLTRRISENIVSAKSRDVSKLMRKQRDFQLRRDEIVEYLMKYPTSGSNLLGTGGGYISIAQKSHPLNPILIKIYGRNRYSNQYQDLRDLVINFSSREPKVKAMEYPYG